MFKQSVAGICSEFTAKLEGIKKVKEKELTTLGKQTDALAGKLRAANKKADAAIEEQANADVAIANIQKLFGVNV